MKVKKFGELNEKRSYGELSTGEKNLSNLCDEVYNAEDVLDGEYNPNATENAEYGEINSLYKSILSDMNRLVELIGKKTK